MTNAPEDGVAGTAGPSVGVIGLGNMGGPMAAHLAASGFTVHGYDTRADAMDALAATGGYRATSPADVATATPIVLVVLPSEAALDAVVFGADGILEAARPGLVVVEMGTFPIPVKQRIAQALDAKGVETLDCPLSGTASQMRAKDTVVYASGDSAAISSCAAIFASFSRATYPMGEFGNGMRLKLVANHLVTIHTAAAAEALLLARRSGLDAEAAYEALIDGAGTSRMLEVRGPMMLKEDYSNPNMPVWNYLKDVDIISMLAREVRSPLPLFALCAQLCIAALGQGRGDEDPAAMYAVLKSMAEG